MFQVQYNGKVTRGRRVKISNVKTGMCGRGCNRGLMLFCQLAGPCPQYIPCTYGEGKESCVSTAPMLAPQVIIILLEISETVTRSNGIASNRCLGESLVCYKYIPRQHCLIMSHINYRQELAMSIYSYKRIQILKYKFKF